MIVPAGFANVRHFSAIQTMSRSAEFALAYQITSWDPGDIEDLYDSYVEFGQAIGWTINVTFVGIQVVVGTSDPSAPLVYEFAGTEGGSGSNPLSSPQVSMLVKKLTNLGGRRGRGRAYIPWVQEGQVFDNGHLDGDFRDGVQTALNDFVTAEATQLGGSPVLLHTDGDDPSELTSLQVESATATQRRRLLRT